jgi:hypothetical protein
MYPYKFKPENKGINFKEIFVVMPFGSRFDKIFDNLILPAVEHANNILKYPKGQELCAYRAKDDMRTTPGWQNVLEHLYTAQIVLGVLDENNANVFYELGIAHATQPLTRQILIAKQGYRPKFDVKDLIYYPYSLNGTDIDGLGAMIAGAVKNYKIEEERRINQARMLVGPYEFEVLMTQGSKRNFALHTSSKGRQDYENELLNRIGEEHLKGSFERHVPAISNLCSHGILGFNTVSRIEDNRTIVEFSYWWTDLGNCLLHFMKLISLDELNQRRVDLPNHFS